jgi:tRNA-specific 2-thiouridylase
MARVRGLFTAGKKDSQGICFVGQIGIREFLGQYVQTKPGKIVEKETGNVLGVHDGAIFYTLGQRHGLDVGGGLPYYVVGKNMDKNEVYVTTDLNDHALWREEITLTALHWIDAQPYEGACEVRIRHRAPLVRAELKIRDGEAILHLSEPQRAVTAGQSAVLYNEGICIGGGIVNA